MKQKSKQAESQQRSNYEFSRDDQKEPLKELNER